MAQENQNPGNMEQGGDSIARRVALVRFSALGDIAMALPAVYDACRANPDVSFFFMTRPLPARLFVNPPENLSIVAVDLTQAKGLAGLTGLASRLYNEFRIDTMVDLHDVLRTQVIRTLLRMRGVRISVFRKERGKRRALTRKYGKTMLPISSVSNRYREAIEKAGLKMSAGFTNLTFSPERINHVLMKTGTRKTKDTWIGIAPFAAHNGKVYPLDQMRQVIKDLAMRPDTSVFIFGAGNYETEKINAITEGLPRTFNMAALAIGLENELALMTQLDLMVSMDSANMHLASLAGCRTVSIWGATHPYCGFMAAGQDPDGIVQLDMTCRPCSVFGNKPCRRGDMHCLHGIAPQMILSHIDLILNKNVTT